MAFSSRCFQMAVCAPRIDAEAMGVLSQPPELPATPKDVIQLVPLGPFVYQSPDYNGGRPVEFSITPEVVGALVSSKEPVDLVVDYEHQTLTGGEAPAAGWIKELMDGGDRGLLGRVEWTPRAAERIAAKEYRYVSPVLLRGVQSKADLGAKIPWFLHSVALVNRPYIGNIEPVAAKQATEHPEENMNKIKEFLVALGMKLDAAATEDQVVAALKQAFAALAQAAGLDAGAGPDAIGVAVAAMKVQGLDAVAEIRKALELKDSDGLSQITGTIAALKQGHSRHDNLATELAALKQQIGDRQAEEAVAAAMTAGKVTPATKESMTAWAKKDLAAFEAFVAKAPVVVSPDSPSRTAPLADSAGQLDAETLAVAKMFGNTKEDLEKHGGLTA